MKKSVINKSEDDSELSPQELKQISDTAKALNQDIYRPLKPTDPEPSSDFTDRMTQYVPASPTKKKSNK